MPTMTNHEAVEVLKACIADHRVSPSNAGAMQKALATLSALADRAGEAVVQDANWFADGPQGWFVTDDLGLARALVKAYDKSDDWTITDTRTPTSPDTESWRRVVRETMHWRGIPVMVTGVVGTSYSNWKLIETPPDAPGASHE